MSLSVFCINITLVNGIDIFPGYILAVVITNFLLNIVSYFTEISESLHFAVETPHHKIKDLEELNTTLTIKSSLSPQENSGLLKS